MSILDVNMFFFKSALWQHGLLSRLSRLGKSTERRVCISSISNEHTLNYLGKHSPLYQVWEEIKFWPLYDSCWYNLRLLIYCQRSLYLYLRKSFLRLSRFGKDKMAYLRAKILIGAVQPNPMSVVSQRISRGVISGWINECFLCITGQQGMLGPGKGINHHHKCRFSSPSHCVYVQTFSSQRILCCSSSSTNTGSLHGKCCSLLLPMMFPFLPLPTTVLPSWLLAQMLWQLNPESNMGSVYLSLHIPPV